MPNDYLEQSTYLNILARSPAPTVKQFVDDLIPALGAIKVVHNRTGLVMAPMHDTGQGAAFYQGAALIAEAYVRLGAVEGYAACRGCDLEQALAIALIDAAVAAGIARDRIRAFVEDQAAALAEADRYLLRHVETTRVEMEAFAY